MRAVLNVARITIKEGFRDKVYLSFLFFAVLLLIFSIFLGMLVVGDPTKVIADFGLAVISIFALLMVIFVGGGSLMKEIQKKTVLVVLSKPINRGEFIIGKILGIWFEVVVNIFLMSLFLFLLILARGQALWGIFVQAGLLSLEMGVLTSIAILFYTFPTYFLSMLFTLSFYLVGHLAPTIEKASRTINNPFLRNLTRWVSYLIPNLEYFNLKNQVIYGLKVPASFYLKSFLYFLLLVFVFTALSILSFEKREV